MNMEFQEFPKWKYKGSLGVIVSDAAAEAALGEGYTDRPEMPKEPSAADLDAVVKEEEVKQATSKSKGKKIDFPKIGK
jgi:hypothetical protein